MSLAAKYLDKSFNIFDEKALGRSPCSQIQDWVADEIESRFGSGNGKHSPAETGPEPRAESTSG
jgi:hypothetical protein